MVQQVQPGDLITASLFNQMLADIASLGIRVTNLEGTSGGPVITGILPRNTDITINALLTVVGTGFDDVPEHNTVTLGGKQITQFNESSGPGVLIFPVPDLFTGLPKTVDLTITTDGKVSNKFPVPLKAQARQQLGTFTVTEASMPIGNLATDSDQTFGWDVFAGTTLDDQLTLSLVVTNPNPAASWALGTLVHSFSPASPMAINPGQTRRVNLTIHTPVGATAADLQLKVVGLDATTTASSPVVPWRVNQSLTPSSANALVTANQADEGAVSLVANMTTGAGATFPQGFTFKPGQTGQIEFHIQDTRAAGAPAGIYACSATLISGAAGDWDPVANIQGDTQPNLTAGTDFLYVLELKNKAGAVGSEYLLRVEAKQTNSVAGINQYTSYAIFPIKLKA